MRNFYFITYMKKMAALIAAIMLIMSGCSTATSNQQQNSPQNESATSTPAAGKDKPSSGEEPIKIGVIVPITGYAALAGESAKKAIELHVEQVNTQGGINVRKVEIQIADSEGKPEVAARVAEKMISEGVVAIAGPYLTPTSFAVEPIITKSQVPMISMSGGFQPQGNNHPWSWTVTAGAVHAFTKVFNYMMENGMKRIATITPTDALGDSGDKALKQLFDGEYKGKLEWAGHEKFNLQDIDITAQISKLKAKEPDLMFVGASGESIVSIRKQMNQVGMQDIPLATYHSNTTREMIKLIGNTPGRMLFPATAANIAKELPDGELKEKAVSYSQAYEKKYGELPMTTEGLGYDSIGVIVEAIRAVGPDREKIGEWLRKGQTIVGANQVYKYTPEDHVGGNYTDLFMVEAEKGQWKSVK